MSAPKICQNSDQTLGTQRHVAAAPECDAAGAPGCMVLRTPVLAVANSASVSAPVTALLALPESRLLIGTADGQLARGDAHPEQRDRQQRDIAEQARRKNEEERVKRGAGLRCDVRCEVWCEVWNRRSTARIRRAIAPPRRFLVASGCRRRPPLPGAACKKLCHLHFAWCPSIQGTRRIHTYV